MKRLGIYYGWPSVINGATSSARAAEEIAVYDVFILGAGLELREHADHHNTREVVDFVAQRSELYGYIALGPSNTNAEVRHRVDCWAQMGVDGVFFDEAGFDFGNDRTRQNAAFDATRECDLKLFVNAFDPDDLFGADLSGRATSLRSGDSYLYESFVVRLGEPEREQVRRRKLHKLQRPLRAGIRLFGVTTGGKPGDFDAAAWTTTVEQAVRHGFSGVGWGEYQFGALDGQLPSRALPLR